MLPLSLLKTAQGHPMLVELKNGETYNGHLVNCDTWMNIHLREVICTSKDGDRFWRMPECYIRGNTIKYLRVPDEVIDKVQEETKTRSDRKPPGVGRGRGRGRDDNAAGRPSKGTGRGVDDGGSKGGGRGKGLAGSKSSGRAADAMADIKEDADHHHHHQQQHLIVAMEAPNLEEEEEAKLQRFTKPKRVASLDIFRGLTVALMILVDDAGGEWPVIGHAPWNGCNLADFVMPFFLFIVGMAIPLAFKRIQDRITAINKVILRTLKLLFWGLLLQGGFSHAPDKLTYGVDMKKIRWCGILQRIALSYLVVAFVEIATRNSLTKGLLPGKFSIFKLYFWHWMVGACVLTVYLGTLYGTYVPDWQFTVQNTDSADFGKVLTVACNVRGKLDPSCNAVGYIDRKVLGINHMYQHPAWKRSKACTNNSPHEGPFRADAPPWCWAPFEPEGILSSISAILSTIFGVHFGHVIVHMKGHSSRLQHWTIMGLGLLISGIILHFTDAIPLNKQLYTLSYVDIWNFKYPFLPLEWIGMNAMLVYVMAAEGIFAGFVNGWYYDDPHNTLIHWIQKHIFIKIVHILEALTSYSSSASQFGGVNTN
ncbi:putative U6 snRNA-associated Sm-like protein LSm4 [Sesamum alatum]|uniref:U6 snRNA-associated Sm-like protein LSm4 n=1 Tax=Sesamum alatum TaxID=300844 RepID=A0AAE1YCJ7_9LAMI|nr:putative U6 snRNA-associated Sm-like protein LSm4 [Sesamum alatum]